MDRTFTVLAAAFGFSAVALGAFGAHGLESALEGVPDAARRIAWWQTATEYLLVHAVALGLSAIAARRWSGRSARLSGWAFAVGAVIFSGSLYVMTLTNVRALGAITPLGGIGMMAGWLLLGVAAVRAARDR